MHNPAPLLRNAELRQQVYREGRQAYYSKAPCPYTDWRAKTWEKGRQSARSGQEAVLE